MNEVPARPDAPYPAGCQCYPMLSNFQVMTRVWTPDRVTAGLAARVNTMFVVPHDVTLAAQVATSTYVWASVPITPVPLVNVAAAQETSATTQVGVAATD